MQLTTPRLVVAGLSGDSGKTLVALGLARACSARGVQVAPCKKGPDYIDAAWLGFAAGAPGRNLDTYLMQPAAIGDGIRRGLPADLVMVEGNRGLFDGLDERGSHSTAELAKLVGAPVILVMDVTKMTRTAAAVVLGCTSLDPDLEIAGIVLNRIGTGRQERVIRAALRESSLPPVVGAIPRLEGDPLPGRHLGLVTAVEHPDREAAIDRAARAVQAHVDLDAVLERARAAGTVTLPDTPAPSGGDAVRIAVFRDEALSFYYPENIEALEAEGAELTWISPLEDRELPDVDGLYFGGGFPEAHVDRLAGNRTLRDAVRNAAGRGMPVYAECGGLMYLARELIVDGVSRPMAGVLDIVVEQTKRPCGHGYVEARVDIRNPFFEKGAVLRGHEFHYSRIVSGPGAGDLVLGLERGTGMGNGADGLVAGRVWGSYLHLHALGTPSWAPALAALAREYRRERHSAGSGEHGSSRKAPGSAPGCEQRSLGVLPCMSSAAVAAAEGSARS
jgi:cobyrinic acid a,c-diamide synthase